MPRGRSGSTAPSRLRRILRYSLSRVGGMMIMMSGGNSHTVIIWVRCVAVIRGVGMLGMRSVGVRSLRLDDGRCTVPSGVAGMNLRTRDLCMRSMRS